MYGTTLPINNQPYLWEPYTYCLQKDQTNMFLLHTTRMTYSVDNRVADETPSDLDQACFESCI